MRNGKGKEYDNDGKLKFAGEYMIGKRWNGGGYNYGNFYISGIINPFQIVSNGGYYTSGVIQGTDM